ncbi:MAG: hypothetical protein C4289_07050 [Chloroflexota bacterium]
MAVHSAEPDIVQVVEALTGGGQGSSEAPLPGALLLPGLEDAAIRRARLPSLVVHGLDLTQLPRLYRALRELGYRYDTTRLPSGAHEIRIALAL